VVERKGKARRRLPQLGRETSVGAARSIPSDPHEGPRFTRGLFMSAIVPGPDSGVQPPHHHGLDLRQELGSNQRVDTHGMGHGEGGGHVEAQHGTRDDPQLAGEPLRQVPDLPALDGQRAVQDGGALGADAGAESAVPVAPAEVPLAEGAEAFFSSSSSRPFET
jgi:hypothetical protein